jgi:hypothetical protein
MGSKLPGIKDHSNTPVKTMEDDGADYKKKTFNVQNYYSGLRINWSSLTWSWNMPGVRH